MTGRGVVLMGLALVTAPGLALADRAVPRGGGSTGSSSAGSSHHSSGGGSSSSSGSSTSSSSSSSSDSSASSSSSRPLTDAQRRHPRAGTGTGPGGQRDRGYRDRGGYYYGSRYYYGGYPYSRSYYGPSWYGYDYWYSPYYYSGYYGYSPRYYRQRDSGSLRLQVQPEKTRVYVDGYYAGIVDDFDGLLQRLYLPPGRHDVTLKLDGYRNHTFKVYVPIDQTIKVHHDMVQGSGEGSVDVVGGPVDYARLEERDARRYDREDARRDDDDDDDGLDREDAGSLRLRIHPGDASVYVDGRFHGAARDVESLRLAPGPHRIEVVRPGFRTVERQVEVSPGRSTELEVELSKQ
jgi:hypothetical protein